MGSLTCYVRAIVFGSPLLAAPALAVVNDTATGGSGSDLVPLTVTKVRMNAEDIFIRHVDTDWAVIANYTFENVTDRPVTLQLGFPEYACEGGDPGPDSDVMCDPNPLRFESMRTTVNGEPVAHRRGTLKKGHAWRPRLGHVWLYDVRFEPRQPTQIEHRYRQRTRLPQLRVRNVRSTLRRRCAQSLLLRSRRLRSQGLAL